MMAESQKTELVVDGEEIVRILYFQYIMMHAMEK